MNEENRPAVANLSSAFENGRIVDGREHVYDLHAWDELWSLSRKPGLQRSTPRQLVGFVTSIFLPNGGVRCRMDWFPTKAFG